MILRGAEFHRNGHGRCGLLPNRISSNDKAELPTSRVLPHAGMILWPRMAISNLKLQNWSDCQDRKPCHATRARWQVAHMPPPDCPMSKGGRYVVSLQHR
jgi:hypothetical protein